MAPPSFVPYPHLVFVRLLIASGQARPALRLLERRLAVAERRGRIGRAIEMRMLQALAWEQLRENARAANELDHALALAEPEGYVRLFIDEGRPICLLLTRIAHTKSPVASYARRLAALLGPVAPAAPDSSPEELLGERELEILRLIAEGYPYRAISDKLVIALSTVQWHIKNIYQKLDAHSGLEAVSRARELALLS